MFLDLQSAAGVENILPFKEKITELESDLRLHDAQGLPAFLLTPGSGKGMQHVVPFGVDEVSNESFFLLRIKSPRFLGLTYFAISFPGRGIGKKVLASLTASFMI
jgi:hypothetical protein